VWSQRRRVVIQIVDQYQRHRDVKRQRHVAIDGHLPQLMRHRRQILPVRRTKLLNALLIVDLRWLPGRSHAFPPCDDYIHSCISTKLRNYEVFYIVHRLLDTNNTAVLDKPSHSNFSTTPPVKNFLRKVIFVQVLFIIYFYLRLVAKIITIKVLYIYVI